MKSFRLALSAVSALIFGGSVHATTRDAQEYLQQARAAAAAQVAAAGVDVGDGLDISARVHADGVLSGVSIARSSGSVETDLRAVKALRRLRVATPPANLIGAVVKVSVVKGPAASAATH